MSNTIELTVHLAYDAESTRWYIAESDVPGLWLEADTATALIERIQLAAPELIELNLTEIIRRRNEAGAPIQSPMRLLPVFDSPLELAAA